MEAANDRWLRLRFFKSLPIILPGRMPFNMSILLFVASSANKYAKCKQICLQICCIFLILEDHFLSEQLVTEHRFVVDDVGSNAARHTFSE